MSDYTDSCPFCSWTGAANKVHQHIREDCEAVAAERGRL